MEVWEASCALLERTLKRSTLSKSLISGSRSCSFGVLDLDGPDMVLLLQVCEVDGTRTREKCHWWHCTLFKPHDLCTWSTMYIYGTLRKNTKDMVCTCQTLPQILNFIIPQTIWFSVNFYVYIYIKTILIFTSNYFYIYFRTFNATWTKSNVLPGQRW